MRRIGTRRPDIVVEAQAGQGKSTLIRQILDRLDTAAVWFQVDPEDRDPAVFLAAVQACLARSLPACPDTAPGGPGSGGMASADLPRRIAPLLQALRSCLIGDVYMVFDDLHHLTGHLTSLFILEYLLANAPPQLHFVLSSREPLPFSGANGQAAGRSAVHLGNHDLSLGLDETADLLHHVFELTPSQDAVREIVERTDGWIMGTLLLGLRMAKGKKLPGDDPDASPGGGIRDYFRRKVFAPLEPALRRPLMALSLLEEIPAALAVAVARRPGVGGELDELARRNLFVRRLDPQGTLFGLHHLFREYLREKAREELTPEEIRDVHLQAGRHFFAQGNNAQALRHLLAAGDHAAMEDVLRRQGLAMLAANQTATLADILGGMPPGALARHGWCALCLALAHLDFAPARALPLLHGALRELRARGDELGELVCLAHVISIHITTTGHYREGEEFLGRAEELFGRHAQSLDPSTFILLSRSLAMGHCIFLADSYTATLHAESALALARAESLVNCEAALLLVRGYIEIFAGRLSLSRPWLERAAAMVRRPEVGTFNCMAIRMMLINFLFHDGDFDNYFRQKAQLVEDYGADMVSQSIVGPFCLIWEMDTAITRGETEEALHLAAQAGQAPLSPHLASQILQLQGVAMALQGRHAEALDASDEATRLRRRAGGLYFASLNHTLTGLTLGLCGRHAEALARLDQGIVEARAMPTAYLESGGLLHRSFVRLETGDEEGAADDAASALGLLRANAYRHFWGWTPRAARRVLGMAVRRGIHAGYARALAARQLDEAILDDGSTLPLLNFQTLGGFAVRAAGRTVLVAQDFTPAQRELLCLLLASPELRMPQDVAQLHFWPDSSPGAAKIKFDTMVSRLRKTFSGALPGMDVQRYLNRDKGIVWLEHCRVDALEFQEAATQGLEHSRLREHWQSGNAFARAEAFWKGDFAPGVTGEDRTRAFRDALGKALARMVLVWGGQLADAGRTRHALELAEKALAADPLSDVLWGLLYRLHGRDSALQARQALNRFVKLLRDEGYPEDEIAQMAEAIARP
ncbi:BTAD domain-containing putative transcriptional regulator [Fundidesulfovibrio magnetotacticus]|uniref:BTAD domain-containing putative transcriptional regulator n=1 Tax=Fundidesulfovibrio magnetotacticus TaxID=2730080 RepID=UPI001C27E2FD|nr:BTAD domain-containing putative transcriptional regulator [Fundidesulfovibrio magnetotacticus]